MTPRHHPVAMCDFSEEEWGEYLLWKAIQEARAATEPSRPSRISAHRLPILAPEPAPAEA
ncbi:MAG: hypothetical protein WB947_02200 [Thermoplasmata archaeon]